MTEPSEPTAPSPSLPPSSRVKRILIGSLLIMAASAVGGAIVFDQSPWLRSIFAEPPASQMTTPQMAASQVTQTLDRLQDQIRMLESHQETSPEAVTVHDQNMAQKIIDLSNHIDLLQKQIADLQNQQTHQYETAHHLIVTAFALRDLRDAVASGQNYAAALAAVEPFTGDPNHPDASISASLAVLFDHSAGVPSWNDLWHDLTAHEPAWIAPVDADLPPWLQQLQKSVQRLITIYPAHNPAFDGLEQAVKQKDAATVSKYFDALPDDARQALAVWHQNLVARQAVDEAVRDLDHHLLSKGGGS